MQLEPHFNPEAASSFVSSQTSVPLANFLRQPVAVLFAGPSGAPSGRS